ncbi:MAG: hypothetical protein HQ546_11390 [Planctomycetes bacterium]|nr:hypothetical protein [Planctomycetota bacterium]
MAGKIAVGEDFQELNRHSRLGSDSLPGTLGRLEGVLTRPITAIYADGVGRVRLDGHGVEVDDYSLLVDKGYVDREIAVLHIEAQRPGAIEDEQHCPLGW